MKKIPWIVLGVILLWPHLLCAQKKKKINTDLSVLPVITGPQYPFPQIIGLRLKNSNPSFQELKTILDLGGRTIKLPLPPTEQLNKIIAQPFTHIFLEIDLDPEKLKQNKDTDRTDFYNKIYSLAKNILTQREISGKTIYLGNNSLDDFHQKNQTPADPKNNLVLAQIGWINLMHQAIEDARNEVNYTRGKIISYTEIKKPTPQNKFFSTSLMIKEIKADTYAIDLSREENMSLGDIKKLLSDLPTGRVFITHASFSESSRATLKNTISYRVPFIFLNDFPDTRPTISTFLQSFYLKQTQAALDMKERVGRFPNADEMADLSYQSL